MSTQKQDSVNSTNLLVCTRTTKSCVLQMSGFCSQMYKVNRTSISLGIKGTALTLKVKGSHAN